MVMSQTSNEKWPWTDPGTVTAEIKQRFREFDSFRSDFDDQAIDNYKILVGYKEERDDERSNMHVPKTYQIVDTIRSHLVKNFFDQRPYIDFLPSASSTNMKRLQANQEKADVASALVDMQLEKNNIVKKFYEFVTSMLTFPAGVFGIGWRYEEQKVKKKVRAPNIVQGLQGIHQQGWNTKIKEAIETVWDDNEIVNVDYFDFWPDPRAGSLTDCRGVFQREWLTREELEEKLNFLNQLGQGIIYDVNLDELAGTNAGLEQGRYQRLAEVGKSSGDLTNFGYNNNPQNKDKQPFEVLHYWENNRHSMLINREAVIYDGPTPYWRHQKLPFVAQSYDSLPNEFYGMSAVDLIHDLQHEINTQRNQRIDNVSMILNQMWKVRRGADIDEEDLVSRPHGIIHVDQMEDVMPARDGNIPSAAFQSEGMEQQTMENVLGTPAIIRGASSGEDQTATEAMKKANNASLRFDTKIKMIEKNVICRMAELMDMNNQQFINQPRLVKLEANSVQNWREIQPDEIIGEFDYKPAGANVDPAANKQVRREQLTNMMMTLIKTKNPFVDMQALTKEWIESFDIRNPQKFLKSKQQAMAEQLADLPGANPGEPAPQGQQATGQPASQRRTPNQATNPKQAQNQTQRQEMRRG